MKRSVLGKFTWIVMTFVILSSLLAGVSVFGADVDNVTSGRKLESPLLDIQSDSVLAITRTSPETEVYEIIVDGEIVATVNADDTVYYSFSSVEKDFARDVSVVAKATNFCSSSPVRTPSQSLNSPTLTVSDNSLVITKGSFKTEAYEIFINDESIGSVTAKDDVIDYNLSHLTPMSTYKIGVVAKSTGVADSPKANVDFTRYYTDAEIDASEYLYGIGKTKNSYVVAKFNSDYSEVAIFKNGTNSDGLMKAFYSSPQYYSPMTKKSKTLTSVVIKDGIRRIGSFAFYNCSNLTGNLTIPDSITSIGAGAFQNCSSLTGDLIIPSGVTVIDNETFRNCSGFNGELIIPDSVIDINYRAFSDCTLLNKITLGSNVKNIGNYAFYNCSSLASDLIIPNGATSIGLSAFQGCSGLIGSLVIPDSVTYMRDWAFGNCKSFNEVIIGNGITNIPVSAFSGCKNVTNVIISDSVTNIDKAAFDGCNNLQNVIIGNSVKTIGVSAFGYSNLVSVTIPDGVVTIGDRAFYANDNIESIVIGSGVESIGEDVFWCCDKLASITVSDNNNFFSDDNGVLFNKCGTLLIQYPIGNTNESYTIPSGVASIGPTAFYCCKNITSVTIPDGVTNIGKSAFGSCTKLKNINIPDGVTHIGYGAFSGCTGLKGNFVIPDSVTSIGDYAFNSCCYLTSVTIGSGVSGIGERAFVNCSNIKDIYFNSTKEDWNAISFGTNWNQYTKKYTIHCANGNIVKL